MRISDWSSDVCSSDLGDVQTANAVFATDTVQGRQHSGRAHFHAVQRDNIAVAIGQLQVLRGTSSLLRGDGGSEEHTSELQSLMRISYDVFCLNKKSIPTDAISKGDYRSHTQY